MASNILKRIIQGITIVLSGLLWRWGGDGAKWCRKWALPMLLALIKCYIDNSLWALLYAPALWCLTALFSYGKESQVHKFWESIFKGDVELITRATCGFFWSLAAWVFLLSGASVLNASLYTIFLTIANSYFGTRKNVWVSEIGVGISVACAILI